MKSFISEDDIEQALVSRLVKDYGWEPIACSPKIEDKDDIITTSRSSVKQCILPSILHESLLRLNPQIDPAEIEKVYLELCQDFSGSDIAEVNQKLYGYIREGVKITTKNKDTEDFDFVRLIDFDHIDRNTFTVVNQMWIQGHFNYRRPDVLLFVNGLPVVFVELKDSDVKMKEAYDKNLVTYRNDIPNIFAFNQICVLSNGFETRIGAWNAGFEFFFEWLRTKDEKQKLNREDIAENGLSITLLVDGLLSKERLLDYIENFIFYDRGNKIIAKNHQYLGVNNLMEVTKKREELKGKLGVFWHTQGSGKSYSMVYYVRKVQRKLPGNWTFLIVTDRDDLDDQIHKTFIRTGVIGPKDETQPKNSAQLRSFLQTDKPILFTLIHKFVFDKGKQYPILSTRNDIIVLVDEAHRTQYKSLAENMHTGLPNANYVAFTGTPLLGTKRLTNQWFGDYVSEYNFAQAIEDKATVPLFYSRRVPEVGLENDFLDDDVVDIIENENLNEREQQLLENSSSRILEVIKRDGRLEKIAKDIAHHFPRRGFLGKGLVVSVDKYTAVRMYEKVQRYWAEEKKILTQERNSEKDPLKRQELTDRINYMDTAEMAVVISEEADEVQKFKNQGLDITPHRKKMNEITPDAKDIEDRFKDPNDNLQLVFVCAMWLTGFDVPSLYSLYLDKPMKGHTLMQAIARANRVYENKPCGIIVDYVNVFKYMKKALSEYARPDDPENFPAKDIDQLLHNLDSAIQTTNEFLLSIGINLEEIIGESDTLDQLESLRQAYNKILATDDSKERFKVLSNTVVNLYDASKPEVFERHWQNHLYAPIVYINGLFCNLIDDEKLRRARQQMANVLDRSVTAVNTEEKSPEYVIHEGKVIDLSKLNIDDVKKVLTDTPYKALEIDDLRQFIEKALQQMINRNSTRVRFSERYKHIIDQYNAGGSENQDYYEKLLELIEELKGEQTRADSLGLNEEELEIYDLLCQDRNLTKAEEQKVILAAKNLYQKLTEKKDELWVVDWYKDEQPRQHVLNVITTTLNADLPQSYDRDVFTAKSNLLLSHFMEMAVQHYGWFVA